MRSANALDRRLRCSWRGLWIIAWLVAFGLTSLSVSASAWAQDKETCSAAHEGAQLSRIAGKISAARLRAGICSRPACPDDIRADCATWLSELEAVQPTVVLNVVAPSAVRVSLDGVLWVESVDDKPRPIDPGRHTLRYVLANGAAFEESVEILPGQKNRKLRASFDRPPAHAAACGEMAQPRRLEGLGPRSPLPWLVGADLARALVGWLHTFWA